MGSVYGYIIVIGYECSTIEIELGGMIMILKLFIIKIFIFI